MGFKADEVFGRDKAKTVIEQWRKHYNTKRPHSALGYRPPAPVAYSPKPAPLDPHTTVQ